jgi:transcriptional/translational regulatory protein YebC/TACO1
MEDFGSVNRKLIELRIEPDEAGLKRIPNDTKNLDVATAKKAMRLIEMLEEDDDVQNVFHNIELTDEIMEELEK